MWYLADTNILLRLSNPLDPLYPVTQNAVNVLTGRGDTVCIVPQTLYEFWTVVTRPVSARGGIGLSVSDAQKERLRLKSLFTLVPDTPAILPAWESIIDLYGVSGVAAHDARLVAAMQVHGLTHLLTFNLTDFSRYPSITAVTPANI
jgi:predicted nucleic acid-binding protein